MRYSENHKAATHQRIIEEASRRFRRDGIGATGLQPLMKALGLTHGGFYAHFSSKDQLVEEALAAAANQLQVACDELFAQERPLPAFIDSYLSKAHRASPEAGCPLPTMSAELGQRCQPSPLTDALIEERLAMLEGALDRPGADESSVALLCTLVGALMLSRSIKDPQLSDRVLDSAKHWLHKQVDDQTA